MKSNFLPNPEIANGNQYRTKFGIKGTLLDHVIRLVESSENPKNWNSPIYIEKPKKDDFINERLHLKNIDDEKIEEILNTKCLSLKLEGFTISRNSKMYNSLKGDEIQLLKDIFNCKSPTTKLKNWQNMVFQWTDGGILYIFKPLGIWNLFWANLCPIPNTFFFSKWENSYIYYDLDGCYSFNYRFLPIFIFNNKIEILLENLKLNFLIKKLIK